MTLASLAFLIFVVAGIMGLSAKAVSEHRHALRQRGGLLDPALGLFSGARLTCGGDGFPILTGRLADQREIRIEVFADTLVCRRLPQLWLKTTILEQVERRRPSIGALARPTGAEFYSLVHDFPEWIAPPQKVGFPILMRGRGATSSDVERAGAMFLSLLANTSVKEAAITPRGVRLVRQISQGDLGAHILFRQIRFPINAVSLSLIRTAIAEAELLTEALGGRDMNSSSEPVGI